MNFIYKLLGAIFYFIAYPIGYLYYHIKHYLKK
jgi:hypothetical protein